MATVFQKYDAAKTAFINPWDVKERIFGFPEIAVSCFSHAIIDRFAARYDTQVIAELPSENETTLVYQLEHRSHKIAFYLSKVGAPASAAMAEEVIALGAKKLVFFGCCGVLDASIDHGEILVPIAAVRDEGTSYHYLPPSEELELDPQGLSVLQETLKQLGYAYETGKTWTSDGIYRETADRVRERKRQGCIAVEMECAALQAVARFRGVGFLQFLYAADSLGAEQWDRRTLGDRGRPRADQYIDLALECAVHWMNRGVSE